MYPLLYRKKTRTSYLLCILLFALTIRMACEPELRKTVWEQTKTVLGSETLFRAVLFLETGILPEEQAPALPSAPTLSAAPAETRALPTEAIPAALTEAETEAPTAVPASSPSFTAEEAEASLGAVGSCAHNATSAHVATATAIRRKECIAI